MFAGLDLVKLAIYAAIAAAACAGIAIEWHTHVAAPYIAQGQAQATAKLQPQIDALQKTLGAARDANAGMVRDLGTLKSQITDSDARWQRADAQAKAAQAAASAARAAAAARAREDAAQIAGLKAIIAAPVSTEVCNGICAEARDILARLAADRLRQ